MSKCKCETIKVSKDKFAELQGVSRYTPGDCVCAECGCAVPYWWNDGDPVPVEPVAEQEPEQ